MFSLYLEYTIVLLIYNIKLPISIILPRFSLNIVFEVVSRRWMLHVPYKFDNFYCMTYQFWSIKENRDIQVNRKVKSNNHCARLQCKQLAGLCPVSSFECLLAIYQSLVRFDICAQLQSISLYCHSIIYMYFLRTVLSTKLHWLLIFDAH